MSKGRAISPIIFEVRVGYISQHNHIIDYLHTESRVRSCQNRLGEAQTWIFQARNQLQARVVFYRLPAIFFVHQQHLLAGPKTI